jgi:aminoglycoside phosphotransferase (APT) family kinase protein
VTDDDVPDLGPVPTRFPVTEELARGLVAAQFPQWAGLPISRVTEEGWDNRTFHLGPEMSIRLPAAEPYALAVEKEHRWLPVLAPRLPLKIPVPVALGRPGLGYPHPWSVYGWLDGTAASRDDIADPSEFARSLARFLAALQLVDPTHGPGGVCTTGTAAGPCGRTTR